MSSATTKEDASLSLEILLSMSPVVNGQDVVTIAARHSLLSYLKGQTAVNETFFSSHKWGNYEEQIDPQCFDFNSYSVLFVCQTICKVKDRYELYKLLDEHKIDCIMEEVTKSSDWKKMGFSLYTLLFQDLVIDRETHVTFKDFMSDERTQWARRLSEHVKHSKWILNKVRPYIEGQRTESEYNTEMNILLLKLHLLDPTTVIPTYNVLRKAFPNLNMELVTTDYLSGSLDWRQIQPDIENRVNQPMYPTNASRYSFQEIEVFYGVSVLEFIMQEPKELGLWTGKHPDNKRVSNVKQRCTVM